MVGVIVVLPSTVEVVSPSSIVVVVEAGTVLTGRVLGGNALGGIVPGTGIGHSICVRSANSSGSFDSIGFPVYGHPGSPPRSPDGSV